MSDKELSKVLEDLFGQNGLSSKTSMADFLDFKLQMDQTLFQDGDFEYYTEKIFKLLVEPRIRHPDVQFNWTNNGCESLNHCIKLAINWKPRRVYELVFILADLVQKQKEDMKASFTGLGDLRLMPHRHKECYRNAETWEKMSPEEQEKVFEKLVKPPAKKSSKVTSADGSLTLNDQSIKKKLGQRVRARANRTFTKNYTSASKEAQPKATSTPLIHIF